MSGKAVPVEKRFWTKVRESDHVFDDMPCWDWTASLHTHGYGQIGIDRRPRLAHRVSYELMRHDIPDGLSLDHLCRRKVCVNPWHLEPVTQMVNTQRANGWAEGVCSNGHTLSEVGIYECKTQRTCRRCREIAWDKANLKRKALA